jgi:2-hydroxychromene-2-carboxylate isomerase
VAGVTRAPIELWFDFGSTYAYFASLGVETLAAKHGRTVAWRPFMLGTAFAVNRGEGAVEHAAQARLRRP